MEKICERKIKWHPRSFKLCQIPKEGLEYAFLSKDYVQIHQFVWCKDFMQDVIHGAVNNKNLLIYGFCYDPKTSPSLDFEKTHLLLNSYKDANFGTKVLNGLTDFIHQIEEQLKMTPTVFEKASNPHWRYKESGVFVAVGDPRWMHSPPMISLYTMLLRVGLIHTKGRPFSETIQKIKSGELKPYYGRKKGENDKKLLETTEKGFKRILKYGDQAIFHEKLGDNYPAKQNQLCISVYSVHDNWGMVGFSEGNTRPYFPKWHKDKT